MVSTLSTVARWFDGSRGYVAAAPENLPDRVDWARILPFILMHLACLGVLWVGVTPVALLIATIAYLVRMFAITGFYHRYFSHRSFKTSRAGQFIFGLLGASAVQRGPVWWAAHHRHHHAHSDHRADLHSPAQHGLLRAHMGWFLTVRGFEPDLRLARDWLKFPELRWLDRHVGARVQPLSWGSAAENQWRADSGVGILRLDRTLLARHLHDQLALARLRAPALSHRRQQPQ
jgi:stearoyl-CoA desaturase (delta-9 desaturase)